MFRSIPRPSDLPAASVVVLLRTTMLLLMMMTTSCVEGFAVLPPLQPPAVAVSMSNHALIANNPFITSIAMTSSSSTTSVVPFPGMESLLSEQSSSSSSFLVLPQVSVSAVTLDPTTFLSDILGGVLGTPLILAVPIAAALAVASLLAYGIIAYASPAESDD